MILGTTRDEQIKILLRKKNIKYRFFSDYGFVNYNMINDVTIVGIKKYNNVYDYIVGEIKGNIQDE